MSHVQYSVPYDTLVPFGIVRLRVCVNIDNTCTLCHGIVYVSTSPEVLGTARACVCRVAPAGPTTFDFI